MSEATNRTPPYTVATVAGHTAVVRDSEGRIVFTIDRQYMLGRTLDEAVALAKDIVKCVNMHDGLVAFAEAYLSAVTNQEYMLRHESDFVAMANDALAEHAEATT